MNRRTFLTRVAAALATVAFAPLLPAPAPKHDYYWVEFGGLYDAGVPVFHSYKLDWPIGLVTFDRRAMLRLTSVVGV